MTERETFLTSHSVLTDLAKWISAPMYVVKNSSADQIANWPKDMGPGWTVLPRGEEGDVKAIQPLPIESVALVLKTFCESHSKLKDIA